MKRQRVVGVAALALLIACGDSTGPVAGTLRVNLVTPHSGDDGAVMFMLSSPVAPRAVAATAGLTLWGAPATGTTSMLVLTGTLSSGTILTLQVDDVKQAGQYSVTLVQVASTGYSLRLPLTGYSATVTR